MLSSRLKNKHNPQHTARWRNLQAQHSSNGRRIIRSRRHAFIKYCVCLSAVLWVIWMVLVLFGSKAKGERGVGPSKVHSLNSIKNGVNSGFVNMNSRKLNTRVDSVVNEFASMFRTHSDTDSDSGSLGSQDLFSREASREDNFDSNFDRNEVTLSDDEDKDVTLDDDVTDLENMNTIAPVWIGVHQNIDLEDVDMNADSYVPKVCGGRLFFAEKLESLSGVPKVFMHQNAEIGKVTKKRTVDDCCTFCALTSGCTAFRFDHWQCSLLTISSKSLSFSSDDNEVVDMKSTGEDEKELTLDFGASGDNEVDNAELQQNGVGNDLDLVSDSEDDLGTDTDDTQVDFELKDDELEGDTVTDSEEVDGLTLTLDEDDETVVELKEQTIVDNEGDEFVIDESETAEELTIGSGEASGSDDGVSESEAEPIDDFTETDTRADESESGGEITLADEVISRESGSPLEDKTLDMIQSEIPPMDLPPELAPVKSDLDTKEQDAVLNEFLGDLTNLGSDDSPFKSSITFNADGSTSFGNMAVEDDVEQKIKAKEEREEDLFIEKLKGQASDKKLSETPLAEILPPGDYRRHLTDSFYVNKFKFFYRFRSSKEITDMQAEISEAYKKPKFLAMKYMSIGKTGDKKNTKTIKVLQFGQPGTGKNVILVSALRGCEWVSPQATTHLALSLIGRIKTTLELLRSVRFHIISVANPEGFDYSRRKSPSSARHWCKNRRVAHGAHGADLSRNWGLDGISWGFGKRGKEGANHMNFQGYSNFSEPETRIIKQYIEHFSTGRGRVALLDVKCCGASITPPQLYKSELEEKVNVEWAANLLAKHVSPEANKYAVVKREPEFNKDNTGQMIDWAHSEAMVDHAYIVDIKSSSLTTRANHALISEEPFLMLSADLERATVLTAQLLLALPVDSDSKPVNKNFPGRDLTTTPVTTASSLRGSSSDHKKKKKKKI